MLTKRQLVLSVSVLVAGLVSTHDDSSPSGDASHKPPSDGSAAHSLQITSCPSTPAETAPLTPAPGDPPFRTKVAGASKVP